MQVLNIVIFHKPVEKHIWRHDVQSVPRTRIARTSISATARFKFSSIPCGGLFLGRDNHILSNSLKNGKRLKTYSNIIPLFRVSSICVCHKIICIYFLTTLKILVDKFSLRYYTAYRILEKRGGGYKNYIARGGDIQIEFLHYIVAKPHYIH